MRTQHENRTGWDRRQPVLSSRSPLEIERRGDKDARSHLVHEEEIYRSEPKKPESYWETLFNLPSRQ